MLVFYVFCWPKKGTYYFFENKARIGRKIIRNNNHHIGENYKK